MLNKFWKSEWESIVNTEELFDYPLSSESGQKIARPKWADVYSGYPKNTSETDDLPADEVFKSILGENYDTGIFNNACATRVSLGLLNGGMNVKKDFQIQRGNFKGKGFITSAANLKNWLSKSSVWGDADETISGPTTLENVQKVIDSKNGVYIILGGFGGGITGHATLWMGSNKNTIGNHNYVSYGGDIYFWELS